MDQDQIARIKNAQNQEDNNHETKIETINLSRTREKSEKIGRHFYIKENLDEWLNRAARKSGKTKSDLIEIAIEFLRDHSEF